MSMDMDGLDLESSEYLRGAFIRLRREASKNTLRQVASRLDVSQPYLSKLERGEVKNPNSAVLAKLIRLLKLDTYRMEVRIAESGQLEATLHKAHARARSS